MPTAMRLAARPFAFVGQRLLTIFHEPPSWAEVSSASMMLLHCWMLIRSPRSPEQWQSLDLLTEMLPGYSWAIISGIGGMIQLGGVVLQSRALRIAGAVGAVLWLCVINRFVEDVFAGWPHRSFMLAWIMPNFFVLTRMFRDWLR